MESEPIENLRNLGHTSASWLREAGITTIAELERLGPARQAAGSFAVARMEEFAGLIMAIADHPRIVVVGTSCCGKTTLCRQLAASLGRPHIELDQLYWGPQWTPLPEFEQRVEQAIAAEKWIADGNYGKVRAAIWKRASAVVWLNYSFPLVLWRALRRTCFRIATGQVLFAGNKESVLQSFFHHEGIPWWVVRTFHRRQRELRQLFNQPEYAHLTLFELRRPDQAVEMAASVVAKGRCPDA